MSVLFRIGARGSPLSMAQTTQTRDALAARLGVDADALPIVPIVTTGDRITDRRLQDAGGKGLFTKELDEALLDGRIDLAIHSLKDLPTKLEPGLALVASPPREDPSDVLIARDAAGLAARALQDLPPNAKLGAASLRRQAQALHRRPDLVVQVLRGNVETRLGKLAAGEVDATFLALAGLKRLGLCAAVPFLALDPVEHLPAIGQGALAITARADDDRARQAAAAIHDAPTGLAVAAERAFLDALDGSCRTPIGAYARPHNGALLFSGEVLTPDGAYRWRVDETCAAEPEAAHALGRSCAARVKAQAGALFPQLA